MSVISLVTAMCARDVEAMSRDDLKHDVADLAVVQSWVEARKIGHARRYRQLVDVFPSIDPELEMAQASRSGRRDSEQAQRRADTVDALPELGAALAAGELSGAHLDAATGHCTGSTTNSAPRWPPPATSSARRPRARHRNGSPNSSTGASAACKPTAASTCSPANNATPACACGATRSPACTASPASSTRIRAAAAQPAGQHGRRPVPRPPTGQLPRRPERETGPPPRPGPPTAHRQPQTRLRPAG